MNGIVKVHKNNFEISYKLTKMQERIDMAVYRM